ncbi:MAG TPA: FAD-binding oxidoreductase [Candidatus Limnocylindrales bacterium]
MTTSTNLAPTFDASLDGRVLRPDDAGYEAARRVWNGMIDRRPAWIVEAASVDDVARTIAAARATGLPLAIRGGGHNVAGNGSVDGGILLDMGAFRTIEVDPERRLVRAGAGATLADIDAATEPHGLVVPIGVVSGTGIAGLTLGGGVGWLVRKHGLTVDNLVAADVVLATGERVTASADRHPDLFWGLRGGGGNFGVVTSFTFRAHPLGPEVLAGSLVYELPRWRDALRTFARLAPELPDELTTLMTFLVPPPDWEMGDRPLLFVGLAWAGDDPAAGRAAIELLRSACPPDMTLLEPTTWRAFQTAFDAILPHGVRAYWRNASFGALDDRLIDALVEHLGAQTWFGTAADLHHMGGAYGRVPAEATAFPNRDAQYWLNIYGFWSDPADDPARVAWVKRSSEAVAPFAMVGQYVNFLGHEAGDARAKAVAVYGEAKVARLQEIKRRYDPENLFRINHNIPPA